MRLPEFELVNEVTNKPLEVDLAALLDGRLWVGEGKAGATLGSPTEARAELNKLRKSASLLGASGILVVSGAARGFSLETKRLIKERLAGVTPDGCIITAV